MVHDDEGAVPVRLWAEEATILLNKKLRLNSVSPCDCIEVAVGGSISDIPRNRQTEPETSRHRDVRVKYLHRVHLSTIIHAQSSDARLSGFRLSMKI